MTHQISVSERGRGLRDDKQSHEGLAFEKLPRERERRKRERARGRMRNEEKESKSAYEFQIEIVVKEKVLISFYKHS